MKRIAAFLAIMLAIVFSSFPAKAYNDVYTVSACGAQSFKVGSYTNFTQDTTGLLCMTGGASGGGPATLASGAVASGAYSAGAFAVGAGSNGWSIPEGSTTDSPCTLPASSTACSELAVQKAIANAANSPANIASATTGGATPYHLIAANSNNATSVSTGAHTIYSVQVTNFGTNLGDLRIYDVSGAPTCSSATGVIANWPAQSNATSPGFTYSFPLGIAIATGLSFCFTGAVADNDNTSFAGSGTTSAAINIGYR